MKSDLPHTNENPDALAGGVFNQMPATDLAIHIGTVLTPTPLDTVKVEGTTNAAHVILRGGSLPVTAEVLPSGSFCVDVPLTKGQQVTLEALGLDGKGNISKGTTVQVRQDPTSPRPPGPTKCTGVVAGCDTHEICNNGKDDDCNGLTDGQDPACKSGCADDPYEHNDSGDEAPLMEQKSYTGLKVCPGDEDWFAQTLKMGQTLTATIHFTKAQGDLNLEVHKPDGSIAAGGWVPMGTETKTAGTPPNSAAGIYTIRIWGVNAQIQNSYDLTVNAQ